MCNLHWLALTLTDWYANICKKLLPISKHFAKIVTKAVFVLNFANCIDIDRLRVILWRICELGWGRGRGPNIKGGDRYQTPPPPHFHNCSCCCPTAPLLLFFAARWVCQTINMNNYEFGPWTRSPRILGPKIGGLLGPIIGCLLGPKIGCLLGPIIGCLLGPKIGCLLGPKIACLLGPHVEKITNRGG